MRPIGHREKDGKRHAVFPGEGIPAGWTFHAEPVPGPDEVSMVVEARLRQEILEDIAKDPQWVARKIEIETEVRGGG